NIHDALLAALRQPPTAGMLPITLFLTDGLPTIGRTNEITIREMVAAANPHGRRIFTFGVGSDVNVPLLDRIATVTRGTSTYVVEGADVELAVAKVFKRLSGPIFSSPVIRTTDSGGDGSTRLVHDLIPAALPDLFEDDQLILLGRYRGEEPITFHVEGEYFDTPRQFQFTFDLRRATVRNAFVPRLWASRRIALLIDQIRQDGAASGLAPQVVGVSTLDDPRHQELVEEILRLSTEFGILTEYTAFLAVEGTDFEDWSAVRGACSASLDARAVRTRSGTAAVNQAWNWGAQVEQRALNRANAYWNESLERVEITAVQQVNDRAFFRRGNRWVDSRLLRLQTLEPTRTINMSSREHADLLHRFLLEGRQGILSLDGEILLLVDGEILLIRGGC
ncbi:MAG: hypothetical protein KJO43_15180, partial [Phycisphaerae bacterium]|nr:hypothetical protein [Phycisphaerae bacterium]